MFARPNRLEDFLPGGGAGDAMMGPIFNCALRDRLVEAARRGDAEALRLLIDAVPQDMPAAVRLAARDQVIRRVADRLQAAMPQAGKRRIATIIAEAGAALDGGHAELAGIDFLDATERAWFRAELLAVLAWLPRRQHDGRRWPGWRQIVNIIEI